MEKGLVFLVNCQFESLQLLARLPLLSFGSTQEAHGEPITILSSGEALAWASELVAVLGLAIAGDIIVKNLINS